MEINIIDEKSKIENEVDEIDKIEDIKYKTILMLCFLDSFSQINVFQRKTKSNCEKFTSFIKLFYPKDYWDEFCMINPIYNCNFNNKLKSDLKNKIKYILFDFPNNLEALSKNNRVEAIITQIKNEYSTFPDQKEGNNIEKYTYINLLYKFRGKLIHEFATPRKNLITLSGGELPRYQSISEGEVTNR